MGRNAERLDTMPEAPAAATVAAEVEAVRPAARRQLKYAGRQSWGTSAFARGGWAYFQPGQVVRFGAAMDRPHGRATSVANTWHARIGEWKVRWNPASERRIKSWIRSRASAAKRLADGAPLQHRGARLVGATHGLLRVRAPEPGLNARMERALFPCAQISDRTAAASEFQFTQPDSVRSGAPSPHRR